MVSLAYVSAHTLYCHWHTVYVCNVSQRVCKQYLPNVLMELSIPEGVPWINFSASNPHLLITSNSALFQVQTLPPLRNSWPRDWVRPHFSIFSWTMADNKDEYGESDCFLLISDCVWVDFGLSSLSLSHRRFRSVMVSEWQSMPVARQTEKAADEPSPAPAGRVATTVNSSSGRSLLVKQRKSQYYIIIILLLLQNQT